MIRRGLGLLSALVALAVLAAGTFAATGGPDGGGYTYIDNHEANGPAYSYRDIRSTGTHLTGLEDQDDDVQTGVSIGFTFNFYGTSYTQLAVSTNGNLQFGTSNSVYTNTAIPTTEFGAAILGWWDDLDFGECDLANLVTQTTGSAPNRQFTIQYNTCHNDEPNDEEFCRADFEMILFESTNEILYQYRDTVFSPQGNPTCDGDTGPHAADHGASATVGIQRDSTRGLQYSNDSAVLNNGLAICFRPSGADPNTVCGRVIATPTPTPTSTVEPTATIRNPNVSGALGGVLEAAAQQARENRERANAAAAAAQPVSPPATGQGASITPPSTGDAGLADGQDGGWLAALAVGAALATAVPTMLTLRRRKV